MDEIKKEELQPELKDIMEMLSRYVEANKRNVTFIGGFISYKPDPEGNKCEDCGDICDIIRDEASRFMAYGNKEEIRLILNELRNMAEDESDENDFVNF